MYCKIYDVQQLRSPETAQLPRHAQLRCLAETSQQLGLTNCLVVSTPMKNISQMGLLFPIYGKIWNVPNHQPANSSWDAFRIPIHPSWEWYCTNQNTLVSVLGIKIANPSNFSLPIQPIRLEFWSCSDASPKTDPAPAQQATYLAPIKKSYKWSRFENLF